MYHEVGELEFNYTTLATDDGGGSGRCRRRQQRQHRTGLLVQQICIVPFFVCVCFELRLAMKSDEATYIMYVKSQILHTRNSYIYFSHLIIKYFVRRQESFCNGFFISSSIVCHRRKKTAEITPHVCQVNTINQQKKEGKEKKCKVIIGRTKRSQIRKKKVQFSYCNKRSVSSILHFAAVILFCGYRSFCYHLSSRTKFEVRKTVAFFLFIFCYLQFVAVIQRNWAESRVLGSVVNATTRDKAGERERTIFIMHLYRRC